MSSKVFSLFSLNSNLVQIFMAHNVFPGVTGHPSKSTFGKLNLVDLAGRRRFSPIVLYRLFLFSTI
jgi:hypothetical protein